MYSPIHVVNLRNIRYYNTIIRKPISIEKEKEVVIVLKLDHEIQIESEFHTTNRQMQNIRFQFAPFR